MLLPLVKQREKERKDGLFQKTRDEDDEKHQSNDAFEANNKNRARDDEGNDSTCIFAFDADRYREVVEKAKAKTLKGGGDRKDEEEKKDKGEKTKDEVKANEENTPTQLTDNAGHYRQRPREPAFIQQSSKSKRWHFLGAISSLRSVVIDTE